MDWRISFVQSIIGYNSSCIRINLYSRKVVETIFKHFNSNFEILIKLWNSLN